MAKPKPTKKKAVIFKLCSALITEIEGRNRRDVVQRLLDKIRGAIRNQ